MKIPEIVLASSSHRRKVLLHGLGIPFTPQASHGQELTEAADLPTLVESNALIKAQAVGAAPGEVVIGADTLVELDGAPLGKPDGVTGAREMLRRLSGRTHGVLTGIAFVARDREPLTLSCRSEVTFRDLDDEEIAAYCDTGEPLDKAGAYGIQGLGALFVERVEGSYTNVVGLPLKEFLNGLKKFTGIEPYQFPYRP